MATSYNNVGVFYRNQGQHEKAEEYYLKAIKIRKDLVENNPEQFNPDLAESYNNAGVFYRNQGQPEKAEKYYLAAIKIREDLVKNNPEQFNPSLAMSYFNFAILKNDNSYFDKALELAKNHPENPYCRKIIEMLS